MSRLPAVDRLLREPALATIAAAEGHDVAKRAVQGALASARRALADGGSEPSPDALVLEAVRLAREALAPRLRAVTNLTGTVIHTNLGRALLAEEAVESVAAAMRGYGALEFDLGGGDRGDRDDIVEGLLRELTGAEAVTVVNNNAAAVVLALAALAARKEAVISHGELIEIGGAFRMPDIMKAAGCRLVAVGTTNRTHPKDYEGAIGPKTGILVKAHWSNYAITGFTKVVDEATVGEIAKRRGVPFLVDLGAGALVDLSQFGLPKEPMPGESLAAGADVVTFSGDKLLGGPQAGILVGTREAIGKIKKHPLKRALRCSKITLAALEATLRVYASGHRLAERLPVFALLTRSEADIRAACERVLPHLARFAGEAFAVGIEPCASQIGSGSLPVERLPSAALVARPVNAKGAGRAAGRLSERLRELPQPAVGRIHDGALWLDLRCLRSSEEGVLIVQLSGAAP
ncbi:MAG: L-seryl-tRNA(Sec) selenium transferase [Betaproteobacteria bacterium]|nr:L-seryl-tRNA(Sec) selenium transferase [Betaproteobacteria bacterium]